MVSSSFSEYRRYLSFLYQSKVRRKAPLVIEMVRVFQACRKCDHHEKCTGFVQNLLNSVYQVTGRHSQFVLDILLHPNSGRRGSSPNGAGWNGCLRCKSVCLEGRSLVHHRFDVYGNCGIEEIDRTFKVNRQVIRNKTQTNTNTKTTTTTNLVRGPWLSPSHSEGWKLSPSYDGRVSDLCVVSQRRKCERVVDLWWTSCESSGSWTNENWCRKVLISLTTGLL